MKELASHIWIFDFEVYAYDWIVVFRNKVTKERIVIHNDYESVENFLRIHNPLLAGANVKHYDIHILKAVLLHLSPSVIKEISDSIIVDEVNGWDIPILKGAKLHIDYYDLFDDVQMGTSVKGYEAHMGYDIVECSVPFDYPEPLTDEQLDEVIYYCGNDVAAEDDFDDKRFNYLNNKVYLGSAKGISPRKALRNTNAKTTAIYLDAVADKKNYLDERCYTIPDKLKTEYIPQEVMDFFQRMYDPSLTREEVFTSKLDIEIGGCPCTVAYGGIHGALPTYREESTETRVIRNKDVASYYPHLMTIPLSEGRKYGYVSRAIPDPEIFVKTLEDRVQAKKSGDKAKNNALKLVLNTTYGCMGNGYVTYDDAGNITYSAMNDLYDPLMCRSVCITGQLFLIELSVHLLQECPSLKIIQLNTDGIMVSIDMTDEPKWQEITQEWQDRTGFELEEDFLKVYVGKDVNNYVAVFDDGHTKVKGGMLVRGISEAGAFKINNNANIVAKALAEYLAHEVSPEKTIGECDDLFQFQLIAKAGSKYSRAYQLIYDSFTVDDMVLVNKASYKEVECQKVNRVFASKDKSLGTLYKVHKNGGISKQSGLPEHCFINNGDIRNLKVSDDLDKDWYIDLCWKQIRMFLGEKEPKKNTRKINSLKRGILKMI